mmetsp:Transcript_29105/g.48946  ORF Transcript_29105/g.48946 Transcript_29105/m.48946 type:complete len:349 (+) Transcript_29105:1713-2759(+)
MGERLFSQVALDVKAGPAENTVMNALDFWTLSEEQFSLMYRTPSDMPQLSATKSQSYVVYAGVMAPDLRVTAKKFQPMINRSKGGEAVHVGMSANQRVAQIWFADKQEARDTMTNFSTEEGKLDLRKLGIDAEPVPVTLEVPIVACVDPRCRLEVGHGGGHVYTTNQDRILLDEEVARDRRVEQEEVRRAMSDSVRGENTRKTLAHCRVNRATPSLWGDRSSNSSMSFRSSNVLSDIRRASPLFVNPNMTPVGGLWGEVGLQRPLSNADRQAGEVENQALASMAQLQLTVATMQNQMEIQRAQLQAQNNTIAELNARLAQAYGQQYDPAAPPPGVEPMQLNQHNSSLI